MTGLFELSGKPYEGMNQTWTGVPIYFHDYFGPGKTAKVLSVKAREVVESGNKYREEPNWTSTSPRVNAVKDVPVPKLLDPVDDLPPTTVITHIRKSGGNLIVRGTTADNGTVAKVLVNGQPLARALAANFAEWEAVLSKAAAGTKELFALKRPTPPAMWSRGHTSWRGALTHAPDECVRLFSDASQKRAYRRRAAPAPLNRVRCPVSQHPLRGT